MKNHDEAFNALLRVQAGAASVEQARQLGFRGSEIAYRRNTRHWLTLLPGVVVSPGAPQSWERDLVAAVLFLGDRGVASHPTAARLLGLEPYQRSTQMEFTIRPSSRGAGGRLVVHSTRQLEDVDVVIFHRTIPKPLDSRLRGVDVLRQIPHTSAARTIIDLAGRSDAESLSSLIDDAVRRRLTSPEFLAKRRVALGSRGLKGSRLLAEILLDAGGHSWLERRFLGLIRAAGIVRPRCQVVFRRDGVTVARVDFHFEGTSVIVEVSGRRGHVSERDRQVDARRRNALQRAGYLVLEFVTTDVIGDPRYVLQMVRAALAGEPITLKRDAASF